MGRSDEWSYTASVNRDGTLKKECGPRRKMFDAFRLVMHIANKSARINRHS